MLFRSNDTATTEIYTQRDTLSLHDALPIFAEPDRELRWLGRVLLPGIFDGEHAFVIEPQANGCRLRHEETFSGLLVPAFGAMLDDTARSFADLNAALKRRVEG